MSKDVKNNMSRNFKNISKEQVYMRRCFGAYLIDIDYIESRWFRQMSTDSV